MEKKNNKKIIVLGMILLIVAGIIVVSLKGFNVALLFGKHEAVELKIGKKVDFSAVEEICKETFQNQNYVIKELELFGDSVQVNVQSITDEEKENFIAKINEKFETAKTVEDLNIYSIPNRRIRDVLNVYAKPMVISFGISLVYMLIRFRKLESLKVVSDVLVKVILTEAILFSLIAITRVPVSDLIINGTMVVAAFVLIYCFIVNEKKLQNIS